MLSQANVRRVKAGVSIDELADDIARRTLLQSLSVREAERLLAGTGWAPKPLRTPDAQSVVVEAESRAETLPAFPADGEDNEADDSTAADPEEPHVVAAE